MIISLLNAQRIDPDIRQSELDAYESIVRELTNNNFQNKAVRFKNVTLKEPNVIEVKEKVQGLRVNDTIEVSYSNYNDGLYTIIGFADNSILVHGNPFLTEENSHIMATLVSYPPDIKRGVEKLIKYNIKMEDKLGIKSETISRMSKTYYDVNATENIEGFPAALLSFLKKHKKIRWG